MRSQRDKVEQLDLIPNALAEQGFGYTAEKMKAVKPRPKVAKPVPTESEPTAPVTANLRRPRSQMPTADVVKAAADRAEERSKKNAAGRVDR